MQEAKYGNHDVISSLFIDEDIKAGENYRNVGIGTVVIGIALLIAGGVYAVTSEKGDKVSIDDDSSLELLKKRYAKGEINKEEFEQMKKDIKGENE